MARAEKREHKSETERERSRRACQRHLADLRRANAAPPADVAIRPAKMPVRLSGPAPSSSCTSPAALCSELIS